MVTMSQRIEELREEKGLSRPAFASALGFPKNAPEKFETGRQTPTKEQQQKMADFFGVSLLYLKGESNDRTRQEDWMEAALSQKEEDIYVPMPPVKKPAKPAAPSGDGSMVDAFRNSKPFQDLVRSTLLDILRSPEGKELLAQVVRKEISRQR